uniref:Uncharacterized protein n=1 Tax=Anguilla anguilla TaxID=7936 RepID=A0A0E9UK85_ANGAN
MYISYFVYIYRIFCIFTKNTRRISRD